MQTECRTDRVLENPGLALGALMAAGGKEGRDKLTILLPATLESFGLWVEQLLAESTGKQGRGIVPITGEPHDAVLGSDRSAVAVSLSDQQPDHSVVSRARAANVPLAFLEMPDVLALGAEFLRWEVATAAAGFILGINPFDEPNVQQAKDATQALLTVFTREQHLPQTKPHAVIEGARISLSSAARAALGDTSKIRLLRALGVSDYFVLLAYLPPDDERMAAVLRHLRARAARLGGGATMAGYGPRYLHSTGQLHKGGPNSGVFLIATAEQDEDLPIPGERFSFGTLEMAQALGDFQSLERAGRRAAHLHLPRREAQLLQHVGEMLLTD
jgi:hypothetical protein